MFEKIVEEFLILIIIVIKDSVIVIIMCVIWFVMKKFIVEEKEVFYILEVKLNLMNSSYGYEFGGLVGVCLMMIGFFVMVIVLYLICNKDGCLIY